MRPTPLLTALVGITFLSTGGGADTPTGEQVNVSDFEDDFGHEGSESPSLAVQGVENGNGGGWKVPGAGDYPDGVAAGGASDDSRSGAAATVPPDRSDDSTPVAESSREEKAQRESQTMTTVSGAGVPPDDSVASSDSDRNAVSPDRSDDSTPAAQSSREEKAQRESRTMTTLSGAGVPPDDSVASPGSDRDAETPLNDE